MMKRFNIYLKNISLRMIFSLVFILVFITSISAQTVPEGLEYIIQGNSVIITGYSGIPQTLIIPNRIQGIPVTRISPNAFSPDHNRLTSVTIPNTVVAIGNSAFLNNRLTTIIIPDNVLSIGNDAFRNNQLTRITIPNTDIVIGKDAFRNNNLSNVIIPNNINRLEAGIFAENPLISITIGENVYLDYYLSGDDHGAFVNSYRKNNSTTGTYTRPDINSQEWNKR